MRLVLLAAGLALAAPQSRWSQDAEPAGGPLLWLDPDHAPLSGAENILTLSGALGRLEDRLLPLRLFRDENRIHQAASTAYRFSKLILLDVPPAAYLVVLQHEVYGHGYRAREAGYRDVRYELGMPPPYGPGDGSTSWRNPAGPGPDRDIAMALAGVEATDILSQRLRGRWLQDGDMDYHAALLYLLSSFGLADYLAATGRDEADESNDMVAYVKGLNGKTGRALPSGYWVDLDDLEAGSNLAFADPFLFFSAWTVLRYVFFGGARWSPPALPLGPVRYLPSLGYRLSPFGGEALVENLAVWGRRSFNLRIAFGDGEAGASMGADLEGRRILAWRGFSLDGVLRFWSQPGLQLEPGGPWPGADPVPGFGAQLAVVSPAISRALPIRFGLGAGAKTSGYAPGERLDAGPTVRIGLGL